jgi:cell wall-associated NlpC family hydrolase
MSKCGDDMAARARALVGARFRPQGRDPARGLDCVGTAAAAAGVPPERVRRDYAMRGETLAAIERELIAFGCEPVAASAIRPGDIIVCEAGPAQWHLLIATATGYVHADAGLGLVVERLFPVRWPIVGVWRADEDDCGDCGDCGWEEE